MLANRLKAILERSGYPVTYHHFNKPPRVPYIVFLLPGSINVFADGQVYQRVEQLEVELYTEKKDPAAERKLESLLDGAGLTWEREEIYIESERLYKITYESEVIEHEQAPEQGTVQP